MTPEHRLMAKIEAAMGERGWMCFRANVGTLLSPQDGRRVSTGLPKGFPDMFFLKDGRALFVETKVRPRKPTEEQIRMLELLRRNGFTAVLAYSVDDVLSVL